MSYSTDTIDCSGLQTTTLYRCLVTNQNGREKLSSIFWLCSRVVGPLVSWAVCYTFLLQGCMEEELDVWKCWDSSFAWLLPLALFKSSIGATRLLGLFAANSSLQVSSFRQYEPLVSWKVLFAAKLGEELDVSVLWVELGL